MKLVTYDGGKVGRVDGEEIDEARWPSFERALSSLTDSEMLV